MKKLSQKKQIRSYLENGGKLTQMAALRFWGCFRLASRTWDINQDYEFEWSMQLDSSIPQKEIRKTMVKTNSGAWVAQYYLERFD